MNKHFYDDDFNYEEDEIFEMKQRERVKQERRKCARRKTAERQDNWRSWDELGNDEF